ncbi:MBL fold metallo-hydrolase [Halomarina oriensis]|uniref:MBL fold metallo-hydrolase n=1 Tax=Halomarina oriensis TaxID=671145 RepID=A0A6B0GDZ6_9EURY|nr:MBL fold metallo-hydrolase [Halomarina oriensis]MWG32914.1 MBL fold metallo-hydrolase [Halomarina oriensis]
MTETDAADEPVLSATALRQRLDADESLRVLDVRNRDEVEAWSIPADDLVTVPYMKFVAAGATDAVADLAAENGLDDGTELVVVCAEGRASAEVADSLREAGVDAVNLDDGMEGWARVYESTVVGESPRIVQYERPSSGCLAYLVVDGDEAAVVDPLRTFADRYVADAEAEGATLRYAIDTHVHADHVSGLRALAERGVEPILPSGARERGVADPERFGFLDSGDAVGVGTVALEAVATPGHTSEMTTYRVGQTFLTGDGVFADRVPRPDLEAGDEGAAEHARDLHRTLTERLGTLPDLVRIAPGHYDPTTADDHERAEEETPGHLSTLGQVRTLPVFGMDADEFVEYVTDRMGDRPANYERIVAVNLGQEHVDDEEAFELELGPNNCAAG